MHDPPELTAELLIRAYCSGLFPMAEARDADRVEWFCPRQRGVVPLDQFHCPKSVRQIINASRFDIRFDTRFRRVMELCAAPRADDPQTWINDTICDLYTRLHEIGLAHSVEAWRGGRLVGGLYGVTLGAAFFGESMFHRPHLGGSNASKVCLVHLVEHLRQRQFTLLDTQIYTDHLARFGCIEIPHEQYMQQLQHALQQPVKW